MVFLVKYFLFGSELTLWDRLCKGVTGMKRLSFYYIHREERCLQLLLRKFIFGIKE
jgi:hypothetical protein